MARHETMMAPKTHGNRGPAVDTLRYYCYVYCVPLGVETMNDKSHTSLLDASFEIVRRCFRMTVPRGMVPVNQLYNRLNLHILAMQMYPTLLVRGL